MFFIESKYKNDGHSTWLKILRELAKADYHFLNLNDEIQLMYLSAKCFISEEKLNDIICDLVKLGEFDKELWEDYKVIFSEKFVDSIRDAYKKRSNDPPTKNDIFLLLEGLGIRKASKSNRKVDNGNQIPSVNPQSIVKNSIVKNKKKINKRKVYLPGDYSLTELHTEYAKKHNIIANVKSIFEDLY